MSLDKDLVKEEVRNTVRENGSVGKKGAREILGQFSVSKSANEIPGGDIKVVLRIKYGGSHVTTVEAVVDSDTDEVVRVDSF